MFLIRVLMGPEYLVSLYEPDHQGKSGHALQMKPSPFASRYSDVQVSMFKHWPWEMLQLTFFVSVVHTSPTSVMGGARQLAGVYKKRPLADLFVCFLVPLFENTPEILPDGSMSFRLSKSRYGSETFHVFLKVWLAFKSHICGRFLK